MTIVVFELINTLVDRSENRRYAAVHVLSELARNAPTFIYAYVPQFLDLLWSALRDSRVVTREAAADALSACLEIVYQRESQQRIQWYRRILDEANKSLKGGSIDLIHGALLTYRELLLRTGMVSELLLLLLLLLR
jgi:FKBP12-rapamycin complex-associated protein